MVDNDNNDDDDDIGTWVYYKLSYEPLAQVSLIATKAAVFQLTGYKKVLLIIISVPLWTTRTLVDSGQVTLDTILIYSTLVELGT